MSYFHAKQLLSKEKIGVIPRFFCHLLFAENRGFLVFVALHTPLQPHSQKFHLMENVCFIQDMNTNEEKAWKTQGKKMHYIKHSEIVYSCCSALFFSLWVNFTQGVFFNLCEDSRTYRAQMLGNRKEQFITGDLIPWGQLLEKKWGARWTLQVTGKVLLITIYTFLSSNIFWSEKS